MSKAEEPIDAVDLHLSCANAAEFYAGKPGLATDPRVTVDIYNVMAQLAAHIAKLQGG
jgi:hypothetical protein